MLFVVPILVYYNNILKSEIILKNKYNPGETSGSHGGEFEDAPCSLVDVYQTTRRNIPEDSHLN
jgi:hypothetical protein